MESGFFAVSDLSLLVVGCINVDTDQLTDLANRRRLFEDLAEHAKLRGTNKITGLAILDIDNFKRYEDTDAATYTAVLSQADSALYTAKNRGKTG